MDYRRVMQEIKRVNAIEDSAKQLDAFIFLKESTWKKYEEEIKNQLDEWFAEVNLSTASTVYERKAKRVNIISEHIRTLSVASSEEEQSQLDYEAMISFMNSEFKNLYWYDKQMLELYIKLGNYRAIEKETGIPWESAYASISKTLKKLRSKIKQHINDTN